MKKVKKFKDFNKHLKIFIVITSTVFMAVGLVHLSLIAYGLDISIGNAVVPKINSYLVVFISMCMVVMGAYYHKAIDSE